MEDSREVTLNAAVALIALVVGFSIGLIVAWILWVQRKEGTGPGEARMAEATRLILEPEAMAPAPQTAVEAEPDDLTRIEGIGPKISTVLQDAGIVTFSRLAESGTDELKSILREEDERLARLADPTTWPEQASLAAAGAWKALGKLQEQLTAGRRV